MKELMSRLDIKLVKITNPNAVCSYGTWKCLLQFLSTSKNLFGELIEEKAVVWGLAGFSIPLKTQPESQNKGNCYT